MKKLKLLKKNVIKLPPKAFKQVLKIINDPKPPNAALKRAARKYRDEVKAGKLKST